LRYYLESETKRIKASGHGISMIHMTKTKMELLLCQIPPIEEQRTIVKKVNTLMNLCDTMEERIKQSQENNGQLMQSLLREVFEGEKSI
jgi:type I restriction enzyme S subunit